MFKVLAAGLLAAVSILFCGPAQAQVDAATAELLMRKAGLWQQLDGLVPQVQAGFTAAAAQPGSALGPDVLERLHKTVGTVYAPARLRTAVQAVLVQSIKPEFVATLVAWYESPVGRRFTELEEATAVPGRDPNVAMQQGVALLKAASPERRALLSEFVVVTKAAETFAGLTINTAIAIRQGMAAAMPGGPKVSTQELRASLEAQRSRMLQAFEGIALASFASMYEPAGDGPMKEYVAFMRAPAGEHFTDLSMVAVERALLDAAAELGRTMGEAKGAAKT
jgi:hypothetical protein